MIYDRKINIPYEHDGIGGLIKKKYFKTLLFGSARSEYDNASLKDYKLKKKECPYFFVYSLDN